MRNLSTELSAYDKPVYVVIDGALLPDLEQWLEVNSLRAYSIFKYDKSPDIARAGPWLIAAGDRHQSIARTLDAVDQKNGGVCWICAGGDDVILRHMRMLNIAQLPNQDIVYFRHYDQNVLAWMAPMLDAQQAARLFGPAEVIALSKGDAAGATIERPANLPPPAPGPITFTEWQYDAILERQKEASRAKIAIHLRSHFGVEDGPFLKEYVLESEKEGRAIGLTTEASLARWAELGLATRGACLGNRAVNDFVMREGYSKSDAVLERDWAIIQENYYSSRRRNRSNG